MEEKVITYFVKSEGFFISMDRERLHWDQV